MIYGDFELPTAENADQMRKAIYESARHIPSVYKVVQMSEYMGMSGEDKYVHLCYALLRENISLSGHILKVLQTNPRTQFIYGSPDADEQP